MVALIRLGLQRITNEKGMIILYLDYNISLLLAFIDSLIVFFYTPVISLNFSKHMDIVIWILNL